MGDPVEPPARRLALDLSRCVPNGGTASALPRVRRASDPRAGRPAPADGAFRVLAGSSPSGSGRPSFLLGFDSEQPRLVRPRVGQRGRPPGCWSADGLCSGCAANLGLAGLAQSFRPRRGRGAGRFTPSHPVVVKDDVGWANWTALRGQLSSVWRSRCRDVSSDLPPDQRRFNPVYKRLAVDASLRTERPASPYTHC